MKLARILLALLVVTAAGVAWAAQTAPATTPEAPAASNAPAESVQAPAQDDVLPLQIDGLFIEPSETDACTCAECFEQRMACRAACGSLDQQCLDQCADEFRACRATC